MGELIVPVEAVGQNAWARDQKFKIIETDSFEILQQNWRVESNAAGHYYFRTEVTNFVAAQNLIEDLEQYFLWCGLYRLHPMRIIGGAKVKGVSDNEFSVLANVFQPSFSELSGLSILSAGFKMEEHVTLSGQHDIDRLYLCDIENSRHQNVAKIFLNARFCSDLTASYILYYSALEILSKSLHESNRNRIQLFLDQSQSIEIRNIASDVVSKLVVKRNEIAHEGVQANEKDIQLLSDIVKRVLQFELFGETREVRC